MQLVFLLCLFYTWIIFFVFVDIYNWCLFACSFDSNHHRMTGFFVKFFGWWFNKSPLQLTEETKMILIAIEIGITLIFMFADTLNCHDLLECYKKCVIDNEVSYVRKYGGDWTRVDERRVDCFCRFLLCVRSMLAMRRELALLCIEAGIIYSNKNNLIGHWFLLRLM